MSSKASNEPQNPQSETAEAVDTSASAPATQGAETFQRRQIVWGRLPPTTFMAGPLPRDEGMARLMAMPPHPQPQPQPQPQPRPAPAPARPAASGLGNFSNVPQAPRKPAATTAPQASIFGGSLVPSATTPTLKPAEAVNPAPVAEAPAVAPAIAQPAISQPALSKAAEAEPVIAPATVEAPTPAAATQPYVAKAPARGSKGLLLAGVAVIAIGIGAFVWWSSRDAAPSGEVDTPVGSVAAPVETADDATAPVDSPVAEEVTPAPAPAEAAPPAVTPQGPAAPTANTSTAQAPRAAPAATPAARSETRPTATAPARQPVAAPAVVVEPQPQAETPAPAPRVTPQPAVPVDPDVPIRTAPTPIDED